MSAATARSGDALVVFGITGDLARKMTLRSLYRLDERGLLDCPVIGVAVDGVLADAGPTLANAFIEADLKHFAYDRLDEAIRWAAAAPQRPVA